MSTANDDDIIVAPGTPLGHAAIGIIRLSGSGSAELVDGLFRPRREGLSLAGSQSRVMHLGYICGPGGDPLDEVLAVVMRGPHSYTRQDVVEIHSHGGLVAASRILERVLQAGARLAEPGEFTRRAFLNGRLDLVQAEAVIDLINARSGAGADQALKQLDGSLSLLVTDLRGRLRALMAEVEAGIDFPDDMTEQENLPLDEALRELLSRVGGLLETARAGRIYREGLAVVLLGKPNTGKSTLLNWLLGAERALVTEVPGTTRDVIEESICIQGIPLRLIDTAGIRERAGRVESMGIERAQEAVAAADLILAMFDAGAPLDREDRMVLDLITGKKAVLLLNKTDLRERLLNKEQLGAVAHGRTVLEISARLGRGRQKLEQEVIDLVGAGITPAAPATITRARQQSALRRVSDSLSHARDALNDGVTLDCVAVDLWDAWSSLGEILGEAAPEEIIDAIFREYCVGK